MYSTSKTPVFSTFTLQIISISLPNSYEFKHPVVTPIENKNVCGKLKTRKIFWRENVWKKKSRIIFMGCFFPPPCCMHNVANRKYHFVTFYAEYQIHYITHWIHIFDCLQSCSILFFSYDLEVSNLFLSC